MLCAKRPTGVTIVTSPGKSRIVSRVPPRVVDSQPTPCNDAFRICQIHHVVPLHRQVNLIWMVSHAAAQTRQETMTSYRLHCFPESGNSYKLALMLTLCGQSFEPVWTDFGGGVTGTPEWRAAVNELGEIPVLEEDRVRLTQTAPILLQLSERYGRFGLAVRTRRSSRYCAACFGTIKNCRDIWRPIAIYVRSLRIPIRRYWPSCASVSTTISRSSIAACSGA
jgi:hypothetical protein